MDPIKYSIYNGNYQKALDIYDSLGIKEENAISLDHANRGLLLHFAGKYTESNFELELSELYMDRLLKDNLSQIISSFIINEYSLPYNGEDYENIMVNFYKAFNYILLDEPEEALVECRRIDYKLNLLYDLYSESTTYHEDAFARYLAGIIYEHLHYFDDAFIEYFKAYEIYNNLYTENYRTQIPEDLIFSLIYTAKLTNRSQDVNYLLDNYDDDEQLKYMLNNAQSDSLCEVIFILETGELPHKEEINYYITLEDGKVIAISLPTMIPHISQINGGIIRTDSRYSQIELVENLGAIAYISLEEHRGRIITRAAARAGLKVLASEAGELIGDKISDEENSLLGDIFRVIISLFGAATEHADLRSWSLLPDKIYIGRIFVEPYEDNFQVNLYLSGKSELILNYNIEPIPGRKVFIKDRVFF